MAASASTATTTVASALGPGSNRRIPAATARLPRRTPVRCAPRAAGRRPRLGRGLARAPGAERSDAAAQPTREPRGPRQPGAQGDDQAQRRQSRGLLEQGLGQPAPERLDRLPAILDLDPVGDRPQGDAQRHPGHDPGDHDPHTRPGQHPTPIRGQRDGDGDQHKGHDRQHDHQPPDEVHGLPTAYDLVFPPRDGTLSPPPQAPPPIGQPQEQLQENKAPDLG
jgi:hypothetical protein